MVDLQRIRNEILHDMYHEAEPSLNFYDVLDNPDDYKDDWYRHHYLPRERQQEIMYEYKGKYNLSKSEMFSLTMECILNLGPSTVKQ